MTVSWVMTYDSLNTMVLQYLERRDAAVVEAIPTFITLAEFEIAQQIKTLGQMQVVEGNMIAGQPVIAKPARWRKTVSMEVTVNGAKSPVLLRKYEYLKSYTPDATTTGLPKFYADYDFQHWLLAPTPSAAGVLEIVYYEQPALLGDDLQTNWLTEYAPDLLLYATLLEATPFLKSDERIQVWQALYDRAAQALTGEDMKRITDRSAVRNEA